MNMETYGEHAERVGEGPCLRCVGKAVVGPDGSGDVKHPAKKKSYWTQADMARLCDIGSQLTVIAKAETDVDEERLALMAHEASRLSALISSIASRLY